jgi:hypothetical protein
MMFSYLPPDFYENDTLTQAILQVVGQEMDLFESNLQDVANQAYVNTAEEWGLTQYESELALPFEGLSPIHDRQANIIAAMRGSGTITTQVLEQIADSWEYGTTQVLEVYGEGLLIVRVLDVRGVPSNLADLTRALTAKKPAHLRLTIEFSYLIWEELDNHLWTWDYLDSLHLTWDQLEVQS